MKPTTIRIRETPWKSLYQAGAVAALVAAIFFRRNIGAEVSLFMGMEAIPTNAVDWFSLLYDNLFVGLSLLAVFDLANYLLVGIVFLSLAVRLWPVNQSLAALALSGGLVGVTINLSSNISLTMFALSHRYAAVTSAAQKADLLSAAQSILAGNDPLSSIPGTSALIGLLLVALAGVLFSLLLLPSHRLTAVFGLLAGGCDLTYCLIIPLAPLAPVYLLLAVGGLFWMLWHLLIARFLFQHMKEA